MCFWLFVCLITYIYFYLFTSSFLHITVFTKTIPKIFFPLLQRFTHVLVDKQKIHIDQKKSAIDLVGGLVDGIELWYSLYKNVKVDKDIEI